MFHPQANIMLYVNDLEAEKNFWSAVGFTILTEDDVMGYPTFEMTPTPDSHLIFSVFPTDFIEAVAPEVIDNQPSVLFKTQEIEALYQKISQLTDDISPIYGEPFRNFNFTSPSGCYYAIAEIKG